MTKIKTTATGGRVPSQPKAGKRATVRTVATGGIADELRRAIAKAEAAGMTRANIAQAAGMTRAMVYRIADGRTLPRIDTAERLILAMGLSLRIVSK